MKIALIIGAVAALVVFLIWVICRERRTYTGCE